MVERSIGLDAHVGFGAFHGAQIAARVLHFVFKAGPRRVMIRHSNVLYFGEIHHLDAILLRANAARLDVIAQRFRHARKQKFENWTLWLGSHGRLFPLR